MRGYLLALLVAAASQAAVIRGTVVENLTGKPLARTTIVLQPIAGTPGATRGLRTNTQGVFEFDSLAPGTYVVKAGRQGFMPIEYGQKRWNSAGTPVVVDESAALFLSIRMLRFSAIRGTVGDENDVGLPEHTVVAYRNSSPPEIVAQGITDDRGGFRLSGLEPGIYLVRTGGKRYDDETYLPTFSRETERVDQARTIEVGPEQEVDFADVRPLAGGRFFNLSVVAEVPILGTDVTLTLASELGRKAVKGASFQFTDLPAGHYEAYAETRGGAGGQVLQAAYQRISLGGDAAITLHLQPPPPPTPARAGADIVVTGTPANDSGHLWVRRKDLAGVGAPVATPLVRGRALLPIGRWEMMLQPPTGYYVASFSGPGTPGGGARADGWNEALSQGYSGFQFSVASGPGGIHGAVKRSNEAVAAVPVYLEGYDATTRTRVTDLRTTRTDARGHYDFGDLAPGTYRILATFEYLAPDIQAMDLAGAQAVTIEAHGQVPLDLELYSIP